MYRRRVQNLNFQMLYSSGTKIFLKYFCVQNVAKEIELIRGYTLQNTTLYLVQWTNGHKKYHLFSYMEVKQAVA